MNVLVNMLLKHLHNAKFMSTCKIEEIYLKKRHVKCKGEATLHIIATPKKIQKIEKQCNIIIIIIIIIKKKLSHSLL